MYFSKNMSYHEARTKLFALVDGKSQNEVEAIKKEYSAAAPVLIEKELKENDGWLTSEPLE